VLGSAVGTEVVVPLRYEGLSRAVKLPQAVLSDVSGLSTADDELVLNPVHLECVELHSIEIAVVWEALSSGRTTVALTLIHCL
jgi:hypothetical protein